ncbi:acyl-CoA carboxylase subunit beta [Streptomyces sp. TRM49041]|uniref:acyl-CoA carboxylase subunit beta n=1 Tax=Streptomyces sp. TRM49041 TaxID=2603216 RepID=UPI0011EF4679|nr:acyl-CoA carboxylase subunit beta [Streptomyces sp. TRM49041]
MTSEHTAEMKDPCAVGDPEETVRDRVDETARHPRAGTTARERVEQLVDEDSFLELDEAVGHALSGAGSHLGRPSDGVVAGYGTIDDRPVAVYAVDSTILGGALDEGLGRRIVKVMDFALKTGCPVIGIHDAGLAGCGDRTSALGVHSEIFRRQVHCSGVLPQISLIFGSCVGTAAFSPALTDFTVMAERTSFMFSASPSAIITATGEDIGLRELGGARSHTTTSGVAHSMACDEEDAVDYVKSLLSYLPSNNCVEPPAFPYDPDTFTEDLELDLDTVVPHSPNQPYDMRQVVEHVLDDQELLETQTLFAPNIITGFGRVEGQPVGVVANQPMQFGGCLDIDASEKAARFVRTCDAFNVPVLTFVDAPGFLTTADQEHSGIIRRGAKLIYAYGEATVPLITVITRKAYGGAYDVMGPKHLGTDLNVAWATAQIAAAGPHTAVAPLFPQETSTADLAEASLAEEQRAELMSEYAQTLLNPSASAERGDIDAMIKPSSTRQYIVRGLRALRTKREILPAKKHGNIPL